MAYKSYAEYFKDPKWQKKRLEVMQRDNFQCIVCGDDSKTLNVHHVEYIEARKPWEYDDKYLWTLCEYCHSEEHRCKELIKDILHDMRISGLPNKQIALFMAQGLSRYRRLKFVESLNIDGERKDLI